uniref:Uncharacterized protein n=1 Tax=Amphimedon queenslandica TaxID=400682 RepID=A0A1X7TPI1_AMPQE
SSCSVSSGQYYVSDDCSSVTQSPCHPLSVYAGNMSQYNNTIFYFIGTTTINDNVTMTAVKNVTLHGLDQSPSIVCKKGVFKNSVSVFYSDHVTISSLSFSYCSLKVVSCNNITITNSFFATWSGDVDLTNAFDLKISSSVFSTSYSVNLKYNALPVCSSELLHYSLILTNVNFTTGSIIELEMLHGTTYNVSIIFDQVEYCANPHIISVGGLFYFLIINSSFHDVNDGPGLSIDFYETRYYTNPGIQLTSTFILEDSQFYNNKQGLEIYGDEYLLGTLCYN